MICIATRDTELAEKLNTAIEGQKAFIFGCTPPLELDDEEGDEKRKRRPRTYCGMLIEQERQRSQDYFRHQLHCLQPHVIVLDVRFGLNDFLAIEQVPLLEKVRSRPAVVLVAPTVSADLKRQAVRLGCFDVIPTTGRAWQKGVASCVSEAWKAHRLGLAHLPPSSPFPTSESVH